jgi:rubrerythrin
VSIANPPTQCLHCHGEDLEEIGRMEADESVPVDVAIYRCRGCSYEFDSSARPVDRCPHCERDLIGKLLPNETFDWIEDPSERAERLEKAAGGPPRWERFKWGHEEHDIYDGIGYWSCPFCGGTWHRFEPSDGRRYRAAAKYIHGPLNRPTVQ